MESIDIVTVAPMAGRRAAAMQTASVRARCGAGHERQQETGLSLIELLVAMTVAAVLLSVAIPSYSSLINASRLTDRKSVVSGKSVAVRLDLGGRRNIK